MPVLCLVQAFVVLPPSSLPPSLYMPHTSLLLALSTLFLFADFVYSNAMYLTFQFPPLCLGPGIALKVFKTEVSSGRKMHYFSF